ncbi:hypothetical protein RUND412_010145 [Rhizina undulata]
MDSSWSSTGQTIASIMKRWQKRFMTSGMGSYAHSPSIYPQQAGGMTELNRGFEGNLAIVTCRRCIAANKVSEVYPPPAVEPLSGPYYFPIIRKDNNTGFDSLGKIFDFTAKVTTTIPHPSSCVVQRHIPFENGKGFGDDYF